MSTRYTNFSEIIIKHLLYIKHFTYYDNYVKKKNENEKLSWQSKFFFCFILSYLSKKQQHWIVRKIG